MTDREKSGPSRRDVLAAGAGLVGSGLIPAHSLGQTGTSVDLANWSPDYVRKIAGTLEVDTAADCAKIVPLDYRGKITYWYVGPNQASPQIEHQIDKEFWAAFARDLSEHHRRANSRSTTTRCWTSCAPPRWVTPRRPSRACRFCGASSSPPRAAAGDEARGLRLHAPTILARRDEVGDLEGQDLRHPDQQRDDGVHLEPELFKEAGLDPEKPPATWDDVVNYSADQGGDRQVRLRHGRARQRRQHAVPLHAAAAGPMAAARWTRPSRDPTLREGLHQQRGQQAPRCRRPTTCTCATSRCRSRR